MSEIYLDNSATTKLSGEVKQKIHSLIDMYGNPSSLHTLGQIAEKELQKAREIVANALGVRINNSSNIIFTASGSEANNLALLGTARAKQRRTANRILISDCEHPSVYNTAYMLENEGFEIIEIPTKGGVLDLNAVEAALLKPVHSASFMLVNNETGALFDVKSAFNLIKSKYPDAICHTDAVQGFLKSPFTPTSLGADLITVSGHKIHAPKGVGALYISPEIIKAKKIVPIIFGGGQEGGFRSGTENTLGICGFGEAIRIGYENLNENITHFRELYNYAYEKLSCLEIKMNIPARHVNHIINITLPNIKSETMLHFLSAKSIYVSSGSACSSHSAKTNRTLTAFGLSKKEADCSLRISFSQYNTKGDIEYLATALNEGITRLIKIK